MRPHYATRTVRCQARRNALSAARELLIDRRARSRVLSWEGAAPRGGQGTDGVTNRKKNRENKYYLCVTCQMTLIESTLKT